MAATSTVCVVSTRVVGANFPSRGPPSAAAGLSLDLVVGRWPALPLEQAAAVTAAFKRQSDVPGRWSSELAAPRGQIMTGPAPQVAGSSVDRHRDWTASGSGSLHELAEAEGLGSDLAVEGIGVQLGQRCTVAHGARA
jgi:hypothetical protein